MVKKGLLIACCVLVLSTVLFGIYCILTGIIEERQFDYRRKVTQTMLDFSDRLVNNERVIGRDKSMIAIGDLMEIRSKNHIFKWSPGQGLNKLDCIISIQFPRYIVVCPGSTGRMVEKDWSGQNLSQLSVIQEASYSPTNGVYSRGDIVVLGRIDDGLPPEPSWPLRRSEDAW